MRVAQVAALALVTFACAASPPSSTLSSTAPARVEVLETRIGSPIDSMPVVGIRIRAPRAVPGYGFAWSVHGDVDVPATGSDPACNPLEAGPAVDLLDGADVGVMYPEFTAPTTTADGSLHEGWLTASLKGDSLMNVGMKGCVVTFVFEAGFAPFDGQTPPPGDPPPDVAPVARIQVRGDGSRLEATPFQTAPPQPATESPAAVEARAIADRLSSPISDWNIEVEPIVAKLTAPNVDLRQWARETEVGRQRLSAINDAMGDVVDDIRSAELLDPFWNVVINYATKLDGLNGIANGAIRGDDRLIAEGTAELQKGVREAPGVLRTLMTAVLPYLEPTDAAHWQRLLASE